MWWFSSIYPQWGQKREPPAPPPVAVTEGKIVEPCEDSQPPQICVRDDETGRVKQVTDGLEFEVISSLVWPPDGRWLAFHRNCDLWLIHPNGSGAKKLLTNSETFCALHIAWSPNSRQIAFLNMPKELVREMWVINQDGTSPHVVHTFERHLEAWGVAWSHNARQFACWYNENGKSKLLLLKADGSGEPEIIEAEDQMPWSWRSDFWPQWGKRE